MTALEQDAPQSARVETRATWERPHAAGKALLPEVGIVALVPETWGEPWTTRHHFLTHLAKYFNVLWVEPSTYWRYLSVADLFKPPPDVVHVEQRSGMRILRASRWQPSLYRPLALARRLRKKRLKMAAQVLRRAGAEHLVMYLWRPEFAPALDCIEHALSCYHIDDEYSFASVQQPPDPLELDLIRSVDRVFIHSARLLQLKGSLNKATSHVPNGVDFAAYSARCAEPEDLARVPHPRVGYVGVIKKQLDLDLVLKLARRRKEWSFVFIGPVLTIGDQAGALVALRGLRNVHFFGSRNLEDLPAYTQHLDVCVLPYKIDAYTACIYPLKLNEYLAAGRPVVGADISSLQGMDDVVIIAQSVDDYEAGIARALGPEYESPSGRAGRLEYASRHDWETIVRTVARQIATGLGEPVLSKWMAQVDEATPASSMRRLDAVDR